MESRSTLHHIDRQVEHARKWRQDGSLEADRIRIRERETHVPYRLPPDEGGCLVRWIKGVIGIGYLLLIVWIGAGVGRWIWGPDGGGLLGGAIAIGILAMQWAAHDDY